jgi:hypothetical protein
MNGQRYLGSLQNEIKGFLEQLSLSVLQRLYYQQDGALPHNARQVVHLIGRFGEQVQQMILHIGPPRSQGLIALRFFLARLHKKLCVHITHPGCVSNFGKQNRPSF